MTWKKIDSDLAVADGAAHAAIPVWLKRNLTSYPVPLSAGQSHIYPAGFEPVFSTHPDMPQGFFFIVDVRKGASSISCSVQYSTADGALGGTVYLTHVPSGATVSDAIPGSTSRTSLTLDLPLPGAPPVGPQLFMLRFQSDVSEPVQNVAVFSGSQRQVQIDDDIGAGTKHQLLILTSALLGAGAGSNPVSRYHLVYFDGQSGPHYSGSGVVWPQLSQSPPVLPIEYNSGIKSTADLCDLGTFTLYGVGFACTGTIADTDPTQPYKSHTGMSAAWSTPGDIANAANIRKSTTCAFPWSQDYHSLAWHGRRMDTSGSSIVAEAGFVTPNDLGYVDVGLLLFPQPGSSGSRGLHYVTVEIASATNPGTVLSTERVYIASSWDHVTDPVEPMLDLGGPGALVNANVGSVPGDFGCADLAALEDASLGVSVTASVRALPVAEWADPGNPMIVRVRASTDEDGTVPVNVYCAAMSVSLYQISTELL